MFLRVLTKTYREQGPHEVIWFFKQVCHSRNQPTCAEKSLAPYVQELAAPASKGNRPRYRGSINIQPPHCPKSDSHYQPLLHAKQCPSGIKPLPKKKGNDIVASAISIPPQSSETRRLDPPARTPPLGILQNPRSISTACSSPFAVRKLVSFLTFVRLPTKPFPSSQGTHPPPIQDGLSYRSSPQPPPPNRFPAPHGRRVVLVAAAALLALAARVARVGDLGAGHGADVDALAVGLVQLEARLALLVGAHRRVLEDSVAGIGTYEDGLPDDVVAGLAVRAQAQRVVDLVAGRGAVECRLGGGVVGLADGSGHGWESGGVGEADVCTCTTDCFCPIFGVALRCLKCVLPVF